MKIQKLSIEHFNAELPTPDSQLSIFCYNQLVNTQPLSSLRVALVYDRVNTRFGGAEAVLVSLHQLFPQAPLFTSVYDPEVAVWAKEFTVKTSFLQTIPFAKKHHRQFVQLMPMAFEIFDFTQFDLVISISSAEAKGIITGPNTLHVCYLLSPTRYLWHQEAEYLTGSFAWLKRLAFSSLRNWDYLAAQRPDYLIPISQRVQDRCEKYYRRETEAVIYPPFTLKLPSRINHDRQPFFLMVSRLVPYKNLDVVIETCQRERIPLKIVGDGPEKARLSQHIYSDTVELLSNVSEPELSQLYQQAAGVIIPGEEDFGIVGLESLAHGTPVIVNARSGVAELIRPSTGIVLDQINSETLRKALWACQKKKWLREKMRHTAVEYNEERFHQRFQHQLEQLWRNFQSA